MTSETQGTTVLSTDETTRQDRRMFALLQPVLRRARAADWRPDASRRSPEPCRRHRFLWVGEDSFSGSSMYECRCGVVRPGL